ncbi:MAG: hypothetical protein INH34_04340 [Phycisphaerales bacterium]|nr:hypothetical protein [Phycisphaerales bacterium]
MRTLAALLLASTLAAQSVEIYSQGPLVTNPGAGGGGLDLSGLQVNPTTPFFMNTLGFGASQTNSATTRFTVCDDFATNGTWIIDAIELFTYQTGILTPSISQVFVEIYAADPSTGGLPVAGSPGLANNLFTTAGYTVTNTVTNIYRASLATPTNTTRPLQSVRIQLPSLLVLDPAVTGTSRYWIEYTFGSTVSTSGPWVPPVSILGSPNTGDGAYQSTFTVATSVKTWAPLQDTGNPVQAVPYKQAAPFKLYGPQTSLPGAITNLGGNSGPVSLAVRGAPQVGGVIHAQLTGTNPLAIPLLWIGFSDPNVPFVVCSGVQHATLDQLDALITTKNIQVPMIPAAVGSTLFMQGGQADFFGGAPGTCNLGIGFTLDITDGFRIRLY